MKLKPLLLLTGLLSITQSIGTNPLQAEETDIRTKGEHCRIAKDRVTRLLCFDELFATPAPEPAEHSDDMAPPVPVGPFKRLIEEIEQSRPAGDVGWLVSVQPWGQSHLMSRDMFAQIRTAGSNRQSTGGDTSPGKWTDETVDIFMTKKEAATASPQPTLGEAVLMLSCENNITTLGVLLPQPIRTLQANLSLSGGDSARSAFRLNWRDIENGDFLIAGRGLESIETIKTIIGYERIQLQVNYPEGPRAFLFDIGDLDDQLKLLRTACHW